MPLAMSKTKEIRKTDMIKTLRITSIIAAVLAAGLFVFPAIFGLRSNEDIKKFLSLPSVVENIRKAKGDRDKGGEGQISPLVTQAQAFGLYLNPPKPVKQPTRTAKKSGKQDIPKPPPRRLTPKFKVIATSFYASHPESSLVLIDEPGKGRHWVRESTVVSHLTIKQIKDGLVVVRGAKGTFELAPEPRPLQRSLVAGSSPVSIETGGQARPKFTSALGPSKAESVTNAGDGITGSELEQMSPEERAAYAERIFAELAAMGTGEGLIESDKTDSEPGAGVEKPVSDFEDMRISGKEAKKLGHLGQELKGPPRGVEQDPNRPKSRKTGKAARELWKKRKAKTLSKPKGTTSRPRGKRTKKKPTGN